MRRLPIVLMSIALAGCATAPRPSTTGLLSVRYTPGYDVSTGPTDVGAYLDKVDTLQALYQNRISQKRTQQVTFDSSMIALATGSVFAAFYRSSAGALGGLGIGASGLGAYRAYYDPEGEGAGYLTAVRALRCVSNAGAPLRAARPQAIIDEIGHLSDEIALVEQASDQLNNDPTASPADKAAGTDAASKAVSAAKAAQAVLIGEVEAYTLAPSTIGKSYNAVLNFVDQKNHRTVVDYNSLQTSISASIDSATTSAVQIEQARTKMSAALVAQTKAQDTANDTSVHAQAPATQPAAGGAKTLEAAIAAPAAGGPAADSTATTGKPTAHINVEYVAALTSATENALLKTPHPLYSATNASVTACTAGL